MPRPLRDDSLARLSRELVVVAFASDQAVLFGIPEQLAPSLDERRVGPGDTIYAEGDMPEHIFFMNEGRVRFTRAAGSYVRQGRWVLGTHEIIAEKPRLRTAIAETDIRLVTVAAEAWIAMVEDNIELARRIAMGVAATVTELHARVGPDGGFPPPSSRPSRGGELKFVERLLMLRAIPFLGAGGVQVLSDLAGASEVRAARAGEALFERGTPRRDFFLVIDGLVEVRREDPSVAARFGPGALVGGAIAFGDHRL